MEYSGNNTSQEVETATTKYHEIEAHERLGAEIRSRCKTIQGASKNTKYHFALASKNHKKSLIKMVIKEDGTEATSWCEVAGTVTDYWEYDVLGFRPIRMHALEAVEHSITRRLPDHLRPRLGAHVDNDAVPHLPTTIVSVQDVYFSQNT